MSSRKKRALALVAASASGWIVASSSHAATVSWITSAGGNWTGPNWSGGVGSNPPTSSDTANFAIANTYTVTLDLSPTVNNFQVNGSHVTFANSTAGRTLTSTLGGNVNSGSLTLNAATPINWVNNNSLTFNTTVNVSNGNDVSVTPFSLTIGSASSSTTTFSGSGTTLSAGSIGLGMQSGRTGTLIVDAGASVSTSGGQTDIGNVFGATGNFTIQGGSSFSGNQIRVSTGIASSGTGTFTITGAGSTLVTGGGAFTVGGGANGTGTANFTNSSSSTLNAGMTVNATGTTNVQSGATISTSATVALASNGSLGGKIFVDGAGSSFTQIGGLAPLSLGSVAVAGGIARLEVTNGGTFSTGTSNSNAVNRGQLYITSGTFNLNGNMTVNGSMGGYVQKDAGGTLNIASGKTLTLNAAQMLINGSYSMSPGAIIAVNNAGSSFDTSGTLTVANGSQLSITNGNASAQDMVIGGTGNGTVTLAGGSHSISGLNAKLLLGHIAGSTGTYNLSGGTLTYTNNVAGVVGEAIGFNGTGNFNQTGGTHISGGTNATLIIGYASTAVGTYTISNGTLFTGALYLARDPGGAQGTLTVNSGATVQVTNEFIDLGLGVGSTGTVNANAGSIFAKGIFVGGISTQARGTGVLNIAGGDVTAEVYGSLANSGQVRIWDTAGSAIDLSAGSLTCDTLITSGNPSRFIWTGGELNITGSSGFAVGSGQPLGSSVSLGAAQDLTISNTLNVNPGGSLSLGGGTISAASLINNGILNITSGTVTTSLLAAGNDGTLSGGTGTGNISITGGIVTASTVRLGSSVGGNGNLVLNASGDLRCDRLATNALFVYGGSVLVSEPGTPSEPVADGSIVAGYVHDGAIIVEDGTVTTPKIKLGPTAGKTGNYGQSGGVVNVTTFGVGNDGTTSGGAGTGMAVITGGTLNVTNLRIGSSAGGFGEMTLSTGGNKTLKTTTLAIDASTASQLDLNDNKLIVTGEDLGSWNGGSYTGITGYIDSGRGPGGAWSGGGIVTSKTDATTSVLTTLAVALADDVGYVGETFGGQSINSGDVLVMYTWGGDAELDGDLDGDDYFWIDSNVGLSGSVFGFHFGDFDYDGDIDGDDYFIIDSNIAFAQTQPPFPTGAGGGLTAVPEPTSAILLAALGGAMCGRRCRRR